MNRFDKTPLEQMLTSHHKNKPMVTGKELAALLHHIHNHEEGDIDTARIIYYEDDLLKVLKAIGLPEPEWSESYSVEEFLKKKNPQP